MEKQSLGRLECLPYAWKGRDHFLTSTMRYASDGLTMLRPLNGCANCCGNLNVNSEGTFAMAAPFDETVRKIEDNLASDIRGKTDSIRLVLISLLAGGHTLLEDAP